MANVETAMFKGTEIHRGSRWISSN